MKKESNQRSDSWEPRCRPCCYVRAGPMLFSIVHSVSILENCYHWLFELLRNSIHRKPQNDIKSTGKKASVGVIRLQLTFIHVGVTSGLDTVCSAHTNSVSILVSHPVSQPYVVGE